MVKYNTIDEYINDQPDGTKQALIILKECIMEAAPDAIEMFNYNIPAFSLVKDGKRDQQVMMVGYKDHVGLYPHPTVMERSADDLKDYKKGKGLVPFPVDKTIPKELIIEMVRDRKSILEIK